MGREGLCQNVDIWRRGHENGLDRHIFFLHNTVDSVEHFDIYTLCCLQWLGDKARQKLWHWKGCCHIFKSWGVFNFTRQKKKSNSLHLLHHIDNGWVTRLLNMIDYRQYLEHASGLCKLGSVVIIIQINGVMLKQHQLPTCSLHLNTSSFLYTHSLLKVFQLRAAGFAPPLWSAAAACSRVIEGSRKEFGERSDASVLRWSSDRPATAVNVRLKSLVSHATIRHANHQSVRGACLVYSR